MKQKFLVKIFLLLSCLSLPLSAQQIVGTASVNGRVINIFDDQTWKYKSSKGSQDFSSCDALKNGIYFCNEQNWKVQPPMEPANAIYQINDRTYLMFIIESLGTNDGFSQEFMMNVALTTAAEAGNMTTDQIPQHFVKELTTNNNNYTSMAYTTKISGLTVTYINNIYVKEAVTVQVALYTIAPNVTDELLDHSDVVTKNIFFQD